MIDLNNSEEFVKEFKIFNDGNAGVVENVKITIEPKSNNPIDDKRPNYRVVATDSKGGSINEGFYYQEADSKAFNNYQAQRLIMLARGILGKDIQFPIWNTPKETLDGVMSMIAPALNKLYRVAVCYGTTKNPDQYLNFKAFGSFIQPMSEPNALTFTSSDCMVKMTPKPTVITNNNPANVDDLPWMNV